MLRSVLVVVGLVLLIAALAGVKFAQVSTLMAAGERAKAAGPPPEVVGSATSAERTWEDTISSVGTIVSTRTVAVSNDAPGLVTRVRFESGRAVREGQILVELDARVERGQAAAAKARLDLAAATARRSRALAARGVISRNELDEDDAQLRAAQNELASLQGVLAKKVVRAPLTGRTGIRAIEKGQYLGTGTTITVLTASGGVFVDFSLPQEELARIGVGMPVDITTVAPVEPLPARITAVDTKLDESTRNLRVRARAPDPEDRLRPGMFVRVLVKTEDRRRVVTVPATAIVHAPYGDSVFVLEDERDAGTVRDRPIQIARQRFVQVGSARGDFVAILEGVRSGEEVVTAGAFKLRNGMRVVVDNSVQPVPELSPHPENR